MVLWIFQKRTYLLEMYTKIFTGRMMKFLAFVSKLIWDRENMGGDINETRLAIENC